MICLPKKMSPFLLTGMLVYGLTAVGLMALTAASLGVVQEIAHHRVIGCGSHTSIPFYFLVFEYVHIPMVGLFAAVLTTVFVVGTEAVVVKKHINSVYLKVMPLTVALILLLVSTLVLAAFIIDTAIDWQQPTQDPKRVQIFKAIMGSQSVSLLSIIGLALFGFYQRNWQLIFFVTLPIVGLALLLIATAPFRAGSYGQELPLLYVKPTIIVWQLLAIGGLYLFISWSCKKWRAFKSPFKVAGLIAGIYMHTALALDNVIAILPFGYMCSYIYDNAADEKIQIWSGVGLKMILIWAVIGRVQWRRYKRMIR